jgi:hypothetical protein
MHSKNTTMCGHGEIDDDFPRYDLYVSVYLLMERRS